MKGFTEKKAIDVRVGDSVAWAGLKTIRAVLRGKTPGTLCWALNDKTFQEGVPRYLDVQVRRAT